MNQHSAYANEPQATNTQAVPEDPWEHRSINMRCGTCMWFAEKPSTRVGHALGRCRRHAPTLSGYPAVFANDWCGDHKLDESKQ